MENKKDKKGQESLHSKLESYVPKEGHSFPVTRREFLAAGLIQGAAAMTFPWLARSLLPKDVLAATAPPAYFEVWASGGAVFPANVAMTDSGRQPFPDYAPCGQGSSSLITRTLADGVTPIFANSVPMFNDAGFYKALNAAGNIASVLKKTYLISIPASLASDSSANLVSAQGLVQTSVGAGAYLPYLQNASVFNPSPYFNPPSPLAFDNFGSLLDAVKARSSDTYANLPKATQTSIAKFIQQMSNSQAQRFQSRVGGADLIQAVSLATDKVYKLASGGVNTDSFDPRNDAALAAIWGIAGQGNESSAVVESAVAMNVCKGNAISGSISRGGFDYHGATRAEAYDLDQSVFALVLNLLKTMEYYQKPGMIQLVTDGSCYGVGPNAPYPGDSNNICSAHFLVYSPTPIPFATISGGALETQIGQFTSGIITDQGPASSSERGIAIATYLNYMALAGLSSQAPATIGGSGLATNQIRDMTVIKS